MNFGHPQSLLWLLLVLPLAGVAVWAALRARRQRATLLGAMADELAPGFSLARRIVRDGLSTVAIGLLVLALAEPQVGTWMREIERRGVDVVVVLDTSRSMLADDIRPTRLDRARREIRGLLDHLKGNRVGLVTFAGDARVIVPMTHDPASYRLFLDDVDTFTNALGGTAVGEGLQLALDAFDPDVPNARVVILLTDGEDHMSDPPARDVAFRALAEEVPIHVVAVGKAEGSTIRYPDSRGVLKVLTDEDGQPVITRPDLSLLESIASISKGAFLSAETTPFPLDEIWEKRIAVMEGVTRATSSREEGVNRFQWALVAALLCLLARGLVRDGRGLA